MLSELKTRSIQAARILRPARYWFEKATYGHERSGWLDQWGSRYQGKPMLVVGNGPSLNQTPLDEFKSVPSIGMNKIDLLFARTSWRPTFIVSVADMVVVQHWDTWTKLDIPVYLGWKTRWYMPKHARPKFDYFLVHYGREFSTDAKNGLGAGLTVTYSALQLAYFCGADPVIIFGVDHSWVQTEKKDLYEVRKGADVNHFDPNYFPEGKLWGLANVEENERDYVRARDAFHAAGRKVYDATIGGKLQVFPKISLDEARRLAGLTSSESRNFG